MRYLFVMFKLAKSQIIIPSIDYCNLETHTLLVGTYILNQCEYKYIHFLKKIYKYSLGKYLAILITGHLFSEET